MVMGNKDDVLRNVFDSMLKNVEDDRLYGDVLMANSNPQINAVAKRLLELGLK